MAKIIWKDVVIAEADKYEEVEGNIYFPPESVKIELLKKSPTPYTCPWKGETQYYNIDVDGEVNEDSVWAYHEPKEDAMNIKDHYAFDKSKVEIEE